MYSILNVQYKVQHKQATVDNSNTSRIAAAS